MTIVMRFEASTKTRLSVRLWLPMNYWVSLKIVRLLLAISVSIWLAGGCLFGCSNTVAADVATEASQAAVHGESCHARLKHAKQLKVSRNLNETFAGISSGPREGMNECPLMIGATAVVSKNSSNSPEFVGATTAPLPLAISSGELTQKQIVDPFLPNRGPTYLRCCVFLI
jgi:hypothetical protein